MKENGLLFSAEMIQAHNAGKKTCTRRTRNLDGVNIYPDDFDFMGFTSDEAGNMIANFNHRTIKEEVKIKCPYGWGGDLIYMKETFQYINLKNNRDGIFYFADCKGKENFQNVKWRSALYMPKVDARNWMKIVSIKMQRLQNITEDEARREGSTQGFLFQRKVKGKFEFKLNVDENGSYYAGFKYIWFTVNNPESWNSNPWAWVIEYEIIKK